MDVKTKLAEVLHPYLNSDATDGSAIYAVDIQVAGKLGGRLKVTILLDSDAGIQIDQCASISRQLGNQLDEIDLFDGRAFTLEVSSPGVDFPLTQPWQYRKNVGRQLQVTLTDGTLRNGRLDALADDHIVLDIAPAKKAKSKKKTSTDEVRANPHSIRTYTKSTGRNFL
jgi:ribosome maturation factor RimP